MRLSIDFLEVGNIFHILSENGTGTGGGENGVNISPFLANFEDSVDSIGEGLLEEFALAGVAGAITLRNSGTVAIIDNDFSLILNERSSRIIIIEMFNPIYDRAGSSKTEDSGKFLRSTL